MTAIIDFLKEYYLYAGIFLLLLVGTALYFKYRAKIRRKSEEIRSHSYVNALNELIAGNNHKARELFVEAVKFDTNNIDAYLKLGMLYRMENNPAKAFKIHKELTIRPNLNSSLMADIYRNIVEDLIALKNYNDALSYVEKVLAVAPSDKWALDIQTKIYAMKEDWKNAFKYLKSRRSKKE